MSMSESEVGIRDCEDVARKFLHPDGPYREHLLAWSKGPEAGGVLQMHGPMFTDLIAYATGLVVMQRLESRHSVLKRRVAWKHRSLPSTLSAELRRAQNKDLSTEAFQANLGDLLSGISELYPGSWGSKAEFIERVCQMSNEVVYDELADERAAKQAFTKQLADIASRGGAGEELVPAAPACELESALRREHVRAAFVKGKVYALRGCLRAGVWTVFRMLSTNPSNNMYLQRCVHLSHDEAL